MDGDYVTLVSAEGFDFVIERRCANVSGTIRAMLVTFPEISTRVLEKVIEYFHYKVRYSHSSEMPEFKVEPEIALELLMASNFLDT